LSEDVGDGEEVDELLIDDEKLDKGDALGETDAEVDGEPEPDRLDIAVALADEDREGGGVTAAVPDGLVDGLDEGV